jgi:hypothetical protein
MFVVFILWFGTFAPSERVALASAFLVLIGVIGEYVAEMHVVEQREWLRTRVKRLSMAILIIGLCGDVLGVVMGQAEMAALTKQAGDAATSAHNAATDAGNAKTLAKGATDTADALGRKANEIGIRLGTASSKMDDLDTRIAAQSPRAKLLVKAAPELFKKLAPFAGQRVRLFVCGQQDVTEQETIDTWGAIANILGPEMVSGIVGTKWEIMRPNLGFAGNCGAAKGLGQGVMVFVSKQASPHTMDAANALSHGLEKALPPSPNKLPGLIDPDFAKLTVDRGYQSREAPWTIVAYDQDLITVLVGEHP